MTPIQDNKLYGIMYEIVQAVREKSIDIHHVFTKEFAVEHGYSEDNRQEFFDRLRGNWWDSLAYINSVKPEDYAAVFGIFTLTDGTKCDGVDVACWVMRNIFADFPLTGDMFFQNDHTNIKKPNILFDPDDMWDAKTDFAYHTPQDNVIQFSGSSNLVAEDLHTYAVNSKTDLMQLSEVFYSWQANEEDGTLPTPMPLGIYGFMASLIYAMFRDVARRKIFNFNWFEPNLASMEDVTTLPVIISSDDLPVKLHIPYEEVNEVYFPTALDALQTTLRDKEERYKKAPEYTIRKMLEIELRQREHLNDSSLWRGFPDKVQQMLRIYLDEHITFLCEQCGIDPSTPEQLIKNNQLFRFIQISITKDEEREEIHKMVCNAVRLPYMSLVCQALKELMENKKIYFTYDKKTMLDELRRLGLPDGNTPGFSDNNFFSYYPPDIKLTQHK